MYLMVRNPGVADTAAFTLLGVSTTRYNSSSRTIGMFGSGIKHAIAKFLKENILVTIVPGNLKMEFATKPKYVGGQQFNQVFVKYSGKDETGASRSSTEDLGFTTEWGVQDWTLLNMAFREIVSNAIDGATLAGGSWKDVEIEVKDAPRAKAGHTAVFLPLTPEVQEVWKMLGKTFLHFSHPELLDKKILPKLYPDDNKTYIYKKGVLVSYLNEASTFDYNLGEELTLDESRNANSWDVRYACSHAISSASEGHLAQILKTQIEGKKVFENGLESNYLHNSYETEEKRAEKGKRFQAAFKIVAGDNAVLTSGNAAVKNFVQKKGFVPVKVEPNWMQVLENYGVTTENQVLDGLEKDGFDVSEPTGDMILAVDRVWELLAKHDLLNGREKPPVKGFTSVMSGEAQTLGLYKDNTVYLHTDLGTMSPGLIKVALEEVSHHVTGATDMSRDLQDFLFRLIVKIVF